MAATSLMFASQVAFIGVFGKDLSPYQVNLGLTSLGFLFLGIAIAVMLRNKIGFPDERHRGRYAVHAFYALAIAIMMVVVVLNSDNGESCKVVNGIVKLEKLAAVNWMQQDAIQWVDDVEGDKISMRARKLILYLNTLDEQNARPFGTDK
nr:hypothetical protein [Tanacetum cinerariifolium]